jgi:hypothetical protein
MGSKWNPFTGKFNVFKDETDPFVSLHLDQTTPQTVINGVPIFGAGLQVGTNAAGANENISATLSAEKCPALTTPSWTLGVGWQYLTVPNRIDKNLDGTGTAVPAGTNFTTAGVTYKVTIVVDYLSGGTWARTALGGTQGPNLTAAGTYSAYITALNTTRFTITPNATALRITISSVSITAMTAGTGDLTLDGNLTVNSPSFFMGGNVGFKTNTPVAPIDIYDPRYDFSTRLDGKNVTLHNGYLGAGWDLLFLRLEDAANTINFGIGGFGTGQTFSYAYLGTAYNAVWQTWLPNGNIGLGTSDAVSLLTLLDGGIITPSADSTTALGIGSHAAPTTRWVTFDTTNKRIRLGASASYATIADDFEVIKTSAVSRLTVASDYTGSNLTALILKSDGNGLLNSIISQKGPGSDSSARALNLLVGATEVCRWGAAGMSYLGGYNFYPATDSTTGLGISSAAAPTTKWVTFDTTNLRVGIGTTAPEFPFQLVRDLGVGNGVNYLGWFGRTDSTGPGILVGYYSDGAAVTGQFIRTAGTANPLYLGTTLKNQAVTILNGGNVGIGIIVPSALLHVKSATNGHSNLWIDATTSAYNSTIEYCNGGVQKISTGINLALGANADYEIYDRENSKSLMVVKANNGGVGIGTSTPGAMLDVNKAGGDAITARYNSSNPPIGLFIGANSGLGMLGSNVTHSGTNIFNIKTTGSWWTLGNSNSAPYAVSLATGTGTAGAQADYATNTRLTVLTDGKVGIGSATPRVPLQVGAGTSYSSTNVGLEVWAADANSNVANVNIYSTNSAGIDNGGSIALGGANYANNPYVFGKIAGRNENGTDYAGYLQFLTTTAAAGVTEKMRISSTGNLGINTTSPSSGTGSNKVCHIYSSDASGSSFRAQSASASVEIQASDIGYIYAPNALYIGTTAASKIGFVVNSSLKGQFDASGNFGIGVAPSYTLDVNGTANATAYRAGGTAAVADGTYNMGKITPVSGATGTITVKGGIITNITQAT